MACSLAPIVERLRDQPGAARACLIALAIYFSYEAFECGYRDRFSPWIYAKRMASEPGARWIWISPWRAGNYLERNAGPNDVVAIDCDFDTWIYPAMGERHSRRLGVHSARHITDSEGRAVGDGRSHVESHLAKSDDDGHEQSVRGDVRGAAERGRHAGDSRTDP